MVILGDPFLLTRLTIRARNGENPWNNDEQWHDPRHAAGLDSFRCSLKLMRELRVTIRGRSKRLSVREDEKKFKMSARSVLGLNTN